MLREFNGLPTHPLLVHATVVLVPALVLAAIAYALLPRMRARVGWLTATLAIVTPLAALVTVQAGEELREVLIEKNYPASILDQVSRHQGYGERTLWSTLGLAVFTGLLLLADRPRLRKLPGWIRPLLTVAVLGFGLLAGVYVLLAGDSGSQAVWEGVL